MSYNPGEMATKLIMKDKSQVRFGLITVETAVETCFRDLGCNDYTNGSFSHEYINLMVGNMPRCCMGGMFK